MVTKNPSNPDETVHVQVKPGQVIRTSIVQQGRESVGVQ